MTQSAIIPRARTEIRKILSPISKCGDNWFESVRVRSPYKSTDKAFRTLQSLGDRAQVEDYDEGFPEEISGDMECISAFVESNSGSLDSRQRKNIGEMLGRTRDYISAAQDIASNLAAVYLLDVLGQPRGLAEVHFGTAYRDVNGASHREVFGADAHLACVPSAGLVLGS